MKFIKKNISQKINLFLYRKGIENREVINRDVLDKPALGNLASEAVEGETGAKLKEVIDGPIILENLLCEYFKEFTVNDLDKLEVKLQTVKAAGSLLLWYAPDNKDLLQALKNNPDLITQSIENKGAKNYMDNLAYFKEKNVWTQEYENLARKLNDESDIKMHQNRSRDI